MKEKILSTKTLYKGGFLEFVENEVEIENTNPPYISRRQYVLHSGGVIVVPMIDEEKVLLVKQFRLPVDEIIYEFPAGKIDPNEEPALTAKRELKEETGFSSNKWTELGQTYPCPGYSTEVQYFYLAESLESGEPNPDPGEIIENYIVSLAEALEMVKDGRIKDGKTINGLYYLLQKRFSLSI